MNEKERKPAEDMLSEEAQSRRQFIKKLGTATFAVTVVGMTGRGAFARSCGGECDPPPQRFSGDTDTCPPERQRFASETDESCASGEQPYTRFAAETDESCTEGAYQRFAAETDEEPPPR
ncbi:MAG: hypothetical protein AMJ79_14730 [Phycisphaerae bacterium SM23_30]|nr:MAG: hypothetical protein AMJ79_14730 [Phycisphaerae bacterium SM23_30]